GLDQDRNSEALEDALDDRDLRYQIGRHLGSICLVVGIELGAEHRSLAVESRRDVVGLAVSGQVEQVAKDAEDRLGRLPCRTGHLRDRVENLKDQRERIQDVQARTFFRYVRTAPGRRWRRLLL